jgi:thioredoxin reductase
LDDDRQWQFLDSTGRIYTSRFYVFCPGLLSNPTLLAIAGIESFQGQSFHTSQRPQHPQTSEFVGKRVGIIGTGATGMQTITALSKISALNELTVLQRAANWAALLHNSGILSEQMTDHVAEWNEGALLSEVDSQLTGVNKNRGTWRAICSFAHPGRARSIPGFEWIMRMVRGSWVFSVHSREGLAAGKLPYHRGIKR